MRIALAVLVGLMVTAVLSIATDSILIAAGIYPSGVGMIFSNRLLLLASAYRAVFGVLGAFLAAENAKAGFRRAVLILGGVATAQAVMGLIVMRSKINAATVWYPISLVILSLQYCRIGGKTYERYEPTNA